MDNFYSWIVQLWMQELEDFPNFLEKVIEGGGVRGHAT